MTKWMASTSRSVRGAAVAIISVIVAGACGGASAQSNSNAIAKDSLPQSMTPIRVMVYNGAYTSMPVHIAEDFGFYKKYNLDAKLTTVNSGPAGVAALLGGSLDFIEPPTDQIIENEIKGNDLKLVVGNETKHFYVLMVSNKVQLPHESKGYPAVMKDFKGLRIGVNALGATTHLMTNVLLKNAGMSPEDVNYVADGSATTALAAWQAGRVDAQMAFTPFPEIVESMGLGRPAIDFSKGQGPKIFQDMGGAFEGFSAKGDLIEQHPDVVNAFIRAHEAAINWMKNPANRGALAAEVRKYVNIAIVPPDKQRATIDLMIDHYNSFLGYTVDRGKAIDAWNRYLLDNHLIPHAVSASQLVYSGAPKP